MKKKNPRITKIIKEMPELPPIPKPEPEKHRPLLSPEMTDQPTMNKMLNETQRISEMISHLRFPNQIHLVGVDFNWDVGCLIAAGSFCLGIATMGAMR